jgi:hypothetical protein
LLTKTWQNFITISARSSPLVRHRRHQTHLGASSTPTFSKFGCAIPERIVERDARVDAATSRVGAATSIEWVQQLQGRTAFHTKTQAHLTVHNMQGATFKVR